MHSYHDDLICIPLSVVCLLQFDASIAVQEHKRRADRAEGEIKKVQKSAKRVSARAKKAEDKLATYKKKYAKHVCRFSSFCRNISFTDRDHGKVSCYVVIVQVEAKL